MLHGQLQSHCATLLYNTVELKTNTSAATAVFEVVPGIFLHLFQKKTFENKWHGFSYATNQRKSVKGKSKH